MKLSLLIKLNNIAEIANKAYEAGCIIRWFEPIDGCTNNVISYGFTALNSIETNKIKKLKGVQEFIYALILTAENKYSLVFEYIKNNIPPRIVFSLYSSPISFMSILSTIQAIAPLSKASL